MLKVQDPKDLLARSRGRNSEMSLNPEKNEYVQHYRRIAEIQDHIVRVTELYNERLEQADEPEEQKNYIKVIDNVNIDHTIATCSLALKEHKQTKHIID